MMKAGEIETFAMANCLILLNNKTSTISTRDGTTDDSRWFPCKTCGRKFPSFQALGGHRTSHKKIQSLVSYECTQLIKPCVSSPEKPKTHVCTICGAEFPTGQALGGHMRRHRQTPAYGGDSSDGKKRKLEDEVKIIGVRNLKRSSSSKRVCFDNLDLSLYLWNDKVDENDRGGVDQGEVVEEFGEKDFLKLELRQPIN